MPASSTLPPPRAALVIEVQERLMEVLREYHDGRALRPDEGLLAVELTFTTLFDNAMLNAPTETLRGAERVRHMASVTRLSSRVAAWPAKTHDRH